MSRHHSSGSVTANGRTRGRSPVGVKESQPPHNLEAERAVLGCCLLHADAVADVAFLKAEDFYLTRYSVIYNAITTTYATQGATGPIVVAEELQRRGRLDEVGGHDQLLDLLEGVVTAADVEIHAEIVREKSRGRHLIATCLELAGRATNGEDAAELAAMLEQKLRNVAGAVLPRGAIADAWAPLRPGLLSEMPAARRWLLRHPDRNGVMLDDKQGDGLLPLGKVGLLTSAGGVGKTMLQVELAVAVVTRRPWLGHFSIDAQVDGDVCLALAEEDQAEVERRLFNIAESMRLSETERRAVEHRLVVLPLAGMRCGVAARSGLGDLRSTTVVDDLLRQMHGRKWALVGLDPLSRFAGVSIDADNDAATHVVTEFERLAIGTGATVLVAHHSSKQARRDGKADSRGASGIEDGVRWVATLCTDDERVLFTQTKSNYSRPMREKDAVPLVREIGGILRAEQAAERDAARETSRAVANAAAEAMVAQVVDVLHAMGSARSRTQIANRMTGRRDARFAAIDEATTRGLVGDRGTAREPRLVVLADQGVCVLPPHTPPVPGTGSPALPGEDRFPVPGRNGNHREPPGTDHAEGRRDLQ